MRALAVLPVVFFHAGFQTFSGGFVGVDIFFVISGYLITTIIISDMEKGAFSLADFYERRARRILPALYIVMFSCLGLAWVSLMPADLKSFAQSLIAVSGFGSNFLFWQAGGYFATAAELAPLLHTWSLAVEEQFYLIFPVFLMLAWGSGRRRTLLMLALVAVASLALAQWAAMNRPGAAFFLLPMRGWELLLGAFAAFHLKAGGREPHAWLGQLGGLLGLLLIVFAVLAFDKQTPFPGLYALVPTVGSVLILLFAGPQTLVGRLLGSQLLVGVGLISYSTYLWHQPLLAFAKHRYLSELDTTVSGVLIAASVALGYLTWRFVEAPFRDRRRFGRRRIVGYSLAGSAFFILVGSYWNFQDGYKGHYYDTLSEQQKGRAQLIAAHTAYDMYDFMFDDGDCRFWGRTMTPELERRFGACAKRYGKAVLVFGDSHAMNLYNVMAKARVSPFVVGVSQGYCRIDTDKSFCKFGELRGFLRRHAMEVKVAVYHQTGNSMLHNEKGDAFPPEKFNGRTPLRINVGQIDKVFGYLGRDGVPLRFVWVGPWAEAQVSSREILFRQAKMNGISLAAFKELDRAIARGSRTSGVEYFSLVDAFASSEYSLWNKDCLIFKDLNHLSRCGEDFMAAAIADDFWAAVIGGGALPGGSGRIDTVPEELP
ncbi:acyltransferase family protein [Massilia glaciei]|uniref:acyltransferase family protein n=1 Tax=Massilia glaciei TaxID=1524097 RepID=UPI0015E81741